MDNQLVITSSVINFITKCLDDGYVGCIIESGEDQLKLQRHFDYNYN